MKKIIIYKIIALSVLLTVSSPSFADGVLKYNLEKEGNMWICSTEMSEAYFDNCEFCNFYIKLGIVDDYCACVCAFGFLSSDNDKTIKLAQKCEANDDGHLTSDIIIKLSNGESFTCCLAGNVRSSVSVAVIATIGLINSNGNTLNKIEGNKKRQAYIATQLSKYDIKYISFCGETFKISTSTAPTFKAMFNTLASKSGCTDVFTYRSSSSSSSSSTSSRNSGSSSSSNKSSTSTKPTANVDKMAIVKLTEEVDKFYVMANVSAKNCKGKTLKFVTRFYNNDDNSQLKDCNGQYEVAGYVAVTTEKFCNSSDWSKGIHSVIPVSELHLGDGYWNLKVFTSIYLDGKAIGFCKPKVFHMNVRNGRYSEITVDGSNTID